MEGSRLCKTFTHPVICHQEVCPSPLSVSRGKAKHSPVAMVGLCGDHMLEACISHGCLDVHLVVQVAVRLGGLHQREQGWGQVLNGLRPAKRDSSRIRVRGFSHHAMHCLHEQEGRLIGQPLSALHPAKLSPACGFYLKGRQAITGILWVISSRLLVPATPS